jgi:DNA-binding response OmpR family regulator
MPKTLLLADDSVTMQKVVGITFANEDVTLVTVDNGDDALNKAREIRPDLVLADVGMPGLDGYALCAALKSEPTLAHVKVLLLTGTFDRYDEARANEVGADGHVAKPFEAQALVERVRGLLSRPAAAAAPAPAAKRAAPAAQPAPAAAPRPPAPAAKAAPAPPPEPAREDLDLDFGDLDFESAAPRDSDVRLVDTDDTSTPLDIEPAALDDEARFGQTVLLQSSDLEDEVSLAPARPAARPASPPPPPAARPQPSPSELERTMLVQTPRLSDTGTAARPRPAAAPEARREERGGSTSPDMRAARARPAPQPGPEPEEQLEFEVPSHSGPGADLWDVTPPELEAEPLEAEPETSRMAARGQGADAAPPWAEPLEEDTPAPRSSGPARKAPAPAPAAAPRAASAAEARPDAGALREALEKMAWDAFGPLSEQIVREVVRKVEEIAWEVIPSMAERVIREEIARIQGK